MTSIIGEKNIPRLSYLQISVIFLLALILQGLNIIGSYVLALAMSIDVGFSDWMAISAAVALVQIFPFSLGGLGVREGAFASILSLYGISVAQATAYSLSSFTYIAILTTTGWLVSELLFSKHKSRAQRAMLR